MGAGPFHITPSPDSPPAASPRRQLLRQAEDRSPETNLARARGPSRLSREASPGRYSRLGTGSSQAAEELPPLIAWRRALPNARLREPVATLSASGQASLSKQRERCLLPITPSSTAPGSLLPIGAIVEARCAARAPPTGARHSRRRHVPRARGFGKLRARRRRPHPRGTSPDPCPWTAEAAGAQARGHQSKRQRPM